MDPHREREVENPTNREHDVVPELPAAPAMAAAAVGDAFHSHAYSQSHSSQPDHQSPPHSPIDAHPIQQRPSKRRGSNASHVAIDHFDPEGVNELKRTVTQQSAAARSTRSLGQVHEEMPPPPKKHGSSSRSTVESTVVSESGGSDKFDFEQHLKDVVRRCAYIPFINLN